MCSSWRVMHQQKTTIAGDAVTPGCGICASSFCLSGCSHWAREGTPKMLMHYWGQETTAISMPGLHGVVCSQCCRIMWLWWREVIIIKSAHVPLFYSQFYFPCTLSNFHVILYLLFLFHTTTSLKTADFFFLMYYIRNLFSCLTLSCCLSTSPFSVLTLSVSYRVSDSCRETFLSVSELSQLWLKCLLGHIFCI